MNFICYILLFSFSFSITLQEAYDLSDSYGNYDKYVILESNSTYTGGLGIYEGNVFIDCNGAIIDLELGNGIWVYADEYYPSHLDIENCVVTNSDYYGLSYGGTSTGSITNCNLINTNFGLKLFDETHVIVTNSIFSSNNTFGIGLYTELPNLEISYSLFWENVESDCMENCPGWGGIWTQYEFEDNLGLLYVDPLFTDDNNWDFNLNNNSPCIDSGNPNLFDDDGSISDIGAYSFNNDFCNIQGDLNQDNFVNVLDVVDMVNCILFNDCNSVCFDLNDDNEYNVLDILTIVNIIIN